MALQTKITGPGGLESENGYRRALGIQVDLTQGIVLIGTGDYKDAAWRKDRPQDYINSNAYKLDATSKPADQAAFKGPDGKVQIVDVDAVPSGPEFLAQPISTYLPGVGPATSLKDLLGAIAYGYLKTRGENAGATDV